MRTRLVADPIAHTPLTDVAPRFDPAQEHCEAASTKLLVRTMLFAHQMVKVALINAEEARNEETRSVAHTANQRSSTLRFGPEALRGGVNKTVTLFIRTHQLFIRTHPQQVTERQEVRALRDWSKRSVIQQ